jgi:hypothetical protein
MSTAVTKAPADQIQPADRRESVHDRRSSGQPAREASVRVWTPGEVLRLIVCATTCACLLIFVAWTFYLVQVKAVGPTMLGVISGSGLLGIGGLIFKILKIALRPSGRIG